MLQQTRMDTVLPYFTRFIEAVPSLEQLAQLPEDALMKLWEGLGYYRRARHLQEAARQVIEHYDGVIPSDPALLMGLKGIGEYTAGAIASTVYQVKVAAIDGNVVRILARLYALDADAKKTSGKRLFQEYLLPLLPEERPGDFNQALMDLGSMVCTAKKPRCTLCPLQSECTALRQGDPERYPHKAPGKARPIYAKTVLLLLYGQHIALERRSEGLLSGLYHYPLLEGNLSSQDLMDMFPGAELHALGPSRHLFSHQEWQLEGYMLYLPQEDERFTWYDRSQFEDFALPSAYKKYVPKWPR